MPMFSRKYLGLPELSLNEIMYGKDIVVVGREFMDNCIVLTAYSKAPGCNCPLCNTPGVRAHGTSVRTVQCMPINMRTTYMNIEMNRYECMNPDCQKGSFVERLPGFQPYRQFSNAVFETVLATSILLSSESASLVLSLMGIVISPDSISRLHKRVQVIDNKDVTQVGIDDVAKRKGQSYYTAIYDLDDGHMIALLDGRDGETLEVWLKDHPRITLAARDRASAYAIAIQRVLPMCTQVADRFHVLKNLVDHMKEIFKDELPEAIFIDENKNEIIDQEPEQIDMIEIPLTEEEIQEAGLRDVDDSAPVDENGNVIVIDDTTTPSKKKDEKKRKTRQELIRAVRKAKEDNPDITYAELGRMFNRSIGTIKRYLAMSEEDVNSAHEKKRIQREKRLSPLKKYANLIYNMLVLGIDPLTIARYIYNHLDYQGSVSSLRGYITVLANKCLGRRITRYQMQQKVYPDGVIRIPRIAILWYIVKKKKPTAEESDVAKYYALIEEKYPLIKMIKEIWETFHALLMGSDPDKLDEFISKYENCEIKSIRSFVEGLKMDIDAVKHAIELETSSGIVEGNNCKFKLLKRILFGRAGQDHLFERCYEAFLLTTDGFKLSDLLELDMP